MQKNTTLILSQSQVLIKIVIMIAFMIENDLLQTWEYIHLVFFIPTILEEWTNFYTESPEVNLTTIYY